MRNGSTRNSKCNRRIETVGMFETLWTMTGPVQIPHGAGLSFWHYSSNVLTVDLTRKRIAHHGYDKRSMTTSRNINGWTDALAVHNLLPKSLQWCWLSWTPRSSRYVSKDSPDARFEAYRARVPWLEKEGDDWWFLWEQWDDAIAETYWASAADLRDDQRWRYFTYDWDADGKWTRRFVDAEAERRMALRTQRRARRKSTTLAREVRHADLS